jgi:hypothetical protein
MYWYTLITKKCIIKTLLNRIWIWQCLHPHIISTIHLTNSNQPKWIQHEQTKPSNTVT